MKFAGSYSRLKNYELCPKRHYNYDLAPWDQRIKEESDTMKEGHRVHEIMAGGVEGKELPLQLQSYEHYLEALRRGEGITEAEKNYAFTRSFQPCSYKANNVFWRCKVDVVKHYKRVALVWDWKTGQRKVEEDQLFLSALAVFIHLPEVRQVHASFVWLADLNLDELTQPPLPTLEELLENTKTTVVYERHELPQLWATMLPRIQRMEKAYEQEDFPPKPSGICKRHCGVVSCPYHGKGG